MRPAAFNFACADKIPAFYHGFPVRIPLDTISLFASNLVAHPHM